MASTSRWTGLILVSRDGIHIRLPSSPSSSILFLSRLISQQFNSVLPWSFPLFILLSNSTSLTEVFLSTR